MSHYDFFQNRECEYFPCHKGADPERFSCLFCYCPLYALGEKCGGSFRYTDKGIKDFQRRKRPEPTRISSQPRYDRFDTSPYLSLSRPGYYIS